jgi:hypothetical protein
VKKIPKKKMFKKNWQKKKIGIFFFRKQFSKNKQINPLNLFFKALTPSANEIAIPPHYTHPPLRNIIRTQAYLHLYTSFFK